MSLCPILGESNVLIRPVISTWRIRSKRVGSLHIPSLQQSPQAGAVVAFLSIAITSFGKVHMRMRAHTQAPTHQMTPFLLAFRKPMKTWLLAQALEDVCPFTNGNSFKWAEWTSTFPQGLKWWLMLLINRMCLLSFNPCYPKGGENMPLRVSCTSMAFKSCKINTQVNQEIIALP